MNDIDMINGHLASIVQAQKDSGISPADFWKALNRIAHNSPILRTALVASSHTRDISAGVALLAAKPIEIDETPR